MASADRKRAVNAEVEATILNHPDFVVIEEKYLTARETELTLKGAVEAIRELRSTLISLSANMRSSGNIKIKSAEESYRNKFGKKSDT